MQKVINDLQRQKKDLQKDKIKLTEEKYKMGESAKTKLKKAAKEKSVIEQSLVGARNDTQTWRVNYNDKVTELNRTKNKLK